MPANPERRPSHEGIHTAWAYPPDFLPLLQLLLATLADLDFEHASDIEAVRTSSADEWLKRTTIRTLQERHQKRRAPYAHRLEALRKQIRLMAA
jgi:nitrate reductase assembly molybdenum cofactor insertion protein NarJ